MMMTIIVFFVFLKLCLLLLLSYYHCCCYYCCCYNMYNVFPLKTKLMGFQIPACHVFVFRRVDYAWNICHGFHPFPSVLCDDWKPASFPLWPWNCYCEWPVLNVPRRILKYINRGLKAKPRMKCFFSFPVQGSPFFFEITNVESSIMKHWEHLQKTRRFELPLKKLVQQRSHRIHVWYPNANIWGFCWWILCYH